MTADPPVVLSPFTVHAETWTRLPDAGFEVLHTYAGNQTIGAQALPVKIRRSPPVPGLYRRPDGLVTTNTGEVFRPEESSEQQCSYCEATDRVLALAQLVDDEDASGALFDALVKVAQLVSKRSPLGRALAQVILGVASAGAS